MEAKAWNREELARANKFEVIMFKVIRETRRRSLGRRRISTWISVAFIGVMMLGAMILASAWSGRPLLAQSSGGASQDNSWREAPPTSTGIPVGQKIPAFSLPDQNGKMQDFNSIKGPNGAALYFMRSADW
jgi:hypothetical protein